MAKRIYNWNEPDEQDVLAIAKVITKYVRFVDPAVVEAIVKDNRLYEERWRGLLEERGVDARLYLWEDSPCCFPGVRRYRGELEKRWFAAQEKSSPSQTFPDALTVDFNEYPKILCSYLMANAISGYSLTHILAHTDITTQIWADLPANPYLNGKGLYGVFTSPANTIHVPNTMLNLINKSRKLKGLLLEREIRLYRQVCALVPPEIQLHTDRTDRGSVWHLDRFEWAPCFGAEVPLKDFLASRKKTIESLLEHASHASPLPPNGV